MSTTLGLATTQWVTAQVAPHPDLAAHDALGLATDAEVATAVAAHAGLSDPHPGYLTPTEGNAAYDPAGAAAAVSAVSVPSTRAISAGTGLTGGGDLSANRTLAPDFGSGAGKVTQGNDARLSDARTPLTHAHAPADTTGTAVVTADPRLTDSRTPLAHTHTHAAATGQTANDHHAQLHATAHQPGGADALAVDAAAATGSLRTLGNGAAQATAGNDARLSDARIPLAHVHLPTYALLANGTVAMALGANDAVKVTPTATATYTTTIPAAGKHVHVLVLTAGTTSFTITFGAGFKPAATLATGTVAARLFVVAFISDGTNLYEVSRTAALVA